MVLAVNIGNTHICIGGYENGAQAFSAKLSSEPPRTADEYALQLRSLLAMRGLGGAVIEGAILGSVVPAVTGQMLAALRGLGALRVLTVGPGLKSGLAIRIDDPAELGAELLCAAVGALRLGPPPVVLVCADTALSVMAVNAAGQLVGGVILPGPEAALRSLVRGTAQLPQVDLQTVNGEPSVLSTNTAACLRAGSILGTAAMLDGLLAQFQRELGGNARVVATGSLPPPVRRACRTSMEYIGGLILDGLYAIWLKNQK